LTALETYTYIQGEKMSFSQVLATLESDDRIQQKDGFYFLRGRSHLVETRLSRYTITDRKFKKVFKGLKALARIPSIRGLYACNTIGFSNVTAQSDVDVFIIVQPGTVWITRLLALCITEWYGLRIHKNETKDKLCLSFYVDTGNQSLKELAAEDDDIYLRYWVHGLLPLAVLPEAYQEFLEINKDFLRPTPNFMPKRLTSRRRVSVRQWNIPFLASCERCAHALQERLISEKKKILASLPDTSVIIDGGILKFHECDRRRGYNQRYREYVKNLNS
jgi:hypothetical protein